MVSTSTGGRYLNKKENVVFKELCMISSLLVKDFGDGQIKGSLLPSNPCDPHGSWGLQYVSNKSV